MPATPELVAEQPRLHRQIVEAIVTRIDGLPDKTPVVHLPLDLGDVVIEPPTAVTVVQLRAASRAAAPPVWPAAPMALAAAAARGRHRAARG